MKKYIYILILGLTITSSAFAAGIDYSKLNHKCIGYDYLEEVVVKSIGENEVNVKRYSINLDLSRIKLLNNRNLKYNESRDAFIDKSGNMVVEIYRPKHGGDPLLSLEIDSADENVYVDGFECTAIR